MNLYADTIKLMADSDLPIIEIARAAKVSTGWVYKVISGEVADPSVKKIQRIYDFLHSQKPTKR